MTNSKNVPAQWSVRVLLAKIGEALDKSTLGTPASHLANAKLKATLEAQFEGRCVYCNTVTDFKGDADHLIPTNKKHLGIHSIGNLVLACKPCNNLKQGLTLDEFLGAYPQYDSKAVRQRIKARKGDVPTPIDVEKIREKAETLYAQVASLVEDAYISALEELEIGSSTKAKATSKSAPKQLVDYASVSKDFPLDSLVESSKKDLLGLVVTYSMQGPKGKRTAYVGVRDIGSGKVIHRAPTTLRLVRAASTDA